jgi:hypothetical protein
MELREDAAARELVSDELVGGYPLALQLAGRSLRDGRESTAAYLERFQQSPEAVVDAVVEREEEDGAVSAYRAAAVALLEGNTRLSKDASRRVLERVEWDWKVLQPPRGDEATDARLKEALRAERVSAESVRRAMEEVEEEEWTDLSKLRRRADRAMKAAQRSRAKVRTTMRLSL